MTSALFRDPLTPGLHDAVPIDGYDLAGGFELSVPAGRVTIQLCAFSPSLALEDKLKYNTKASYTQLVAVTIAM